MLFGVGASLLMKQAEHSGLATGLAGLNALAMVGKLLGRWPLNIVVVGPEDHQVMPAPFTDPKVLCIIVLLIVFGALAFWTRRASSA